MKSVIEGLFAGLLDNNNISDKSKKNKSDSNEDFSSDINGILLSVNQNGSSVEKKDIPGNKNRDTCFNFSSSESPDMKCDNLSITARSVKE